MSFALAIPALDIASSVFGDSGGAAPPVYDSSAVAYFAAMSVQPDATRKGLINDLIVGLKADGVWSTQDWLVLTASHDSQAGMLNAINPAKALSGISGPTFTTDRGYAGNGSNSYLSLGESAGAAGNQYSQNSGCFGAWVNQSSADGWVIGNVATVPNLGLQIILASGDGTRVNNASATASTVYGSRLGHRTLSRQSSATLVEYYNGSGAVAVSQTSAAVQTEFMSIDRIAASNYGSHRVAAFYSGAGLSGVQVAALHGRLNTYLTAIGAN